MARYYGDFRSLDTSNDPKGQKYRVLIFTNYDGSVPYQYEPTSLAPDAPLRPLKGTELTLTDHPFTVTYEGDTENIYKPYRCSSASVSFMQSAINPDFLNGNGTSTMVVLLKWKNEVSEVNGRMYNRTTGETLNKKTVTDGTFVVYDDYEPYKYDKFCYAVEWIGFSTPETFSMEYDSIHNAFTLNCQDALSTLKYSKYEWIGDGNDVCQPMIDILLNHVGSLGTYQKIYITDTIKFPTLFTGGQSGNAMQYICEQQQNNFNEDDKPNDKLSVLSQLLTYLGLTAIPYRNTLVITTPDAVAEGWGNYNVWKLPESAYFCIFGGGSFSRSNDEWLSDSHAVTAESFTSGGTQIGTSNVYSSVTAENDIYYIDDILPNIGNDENFEDKERHSRNLTYGGTRYYWRCNTVRSIIDSLQTYQYEDDEYSFTASLVDELTQTYDIEYTISFSESRVETPNYAQNLVNHPTCVVMDNYGVDTEQSASKNRVLYFHARPWLYGTLPTWYNGQHMNNPQCHQNFRTLLDAQSKKQALMVVKSKGFWGNSGLFLNIRGSWTFYYGNFNNISIYPHQFTTAGQGAAQANPTANYVYAKIKYGHYWLSNGAVQGHYVWQTAECFVKLYYNVEEGANVFGTSCPFKQRYLGVEGATVELPQLDYISNVEATIYRPLGFASNTASCAILTGFDMKVITERELFDEDYKDNRDNEEHKAEMQTEAVEEYGDIELKLNTTHEKNINYSQVLRKKNGLGYEVMPAIYNVATGNHVNAERHIVRNVARQYGTPTINLTMALHNNITPYTLLTWGQLPNRKFVVQSCETDYESETCEVHVSEVKTAACTVTETKRNKTRNYRRNADLIAHDKPTKIQRETLSGETADTITAQASAINGIARLLTVDEIPASATTIQPNFDSGSMLVSVPDGSQNALGFTVENGELIVTITD